MEWGQILNWIIYLVTTLISLIKFKHHHFLFKMISIDSIFSAVHFFKVFFENASEDMRESVVIENSKQLYKTPLIERYIYYTIVNIFYITTCNFFMLSDIKIIYGGLILSCIPPILNKITNSNLFIKHVRKRKQRLIKIVASKQLVTIIKYSSSNLINKDITLEHTELLPLFEDDNYEETMNYMWDIFQTVLITLASCYVKKCSTKFYYKITKYIYKYKTGNTLKSFNEESAKLTLINIIDNKKWNELFKPDVYRASIHLYYAKDDPPDIFRILAVKTNYKMGQTFAVWTISSLYNSMLIAPIVTLVLVIYKDKKVTWKTAGSLVISTLVGFYSNNIFITSLSCLFTEPLIFNKVVYSTGRYLVKESYYKIQELCIRNAEYNIVVLLTTLLMIIFRLLDYYDIRDLKNVFLITMSGVCKNSIKKLVIFLLLLLGGNTSNFNPLHVVHNSIVMYISIESIVYLIDKIIKSQPENVVIKDLPQDLFIKEISVEHHVLSKSYLVINDYCE